MIGRSLLSYHKQTVTVTCLAHILFLFFLTQLGQTVDLSVETVNTMI